MKPKYMIASGWWSTEKEKDTRDKLIGDDRQRTKEFHALWLSAIQRFCSPEEIVIIDSASPLKPRLNKDHKWIEMSMNFGHATNHVGKYSGVTRSFIMSLMYCYLNDYEYWVYIEQDCLIYGEGIVESAIASMKKPILFGSGNGTPQPMQQSFMIIKRNAIPDFVYRLQKIDVEDSKVDPEKKFIIASQPLIDFVPKWLFNKLIQSSMTSKKFIKIIILLSRIFKPFDNLSFGCGRARPITFSDTYFYFQHGNEVELDTYIKKMSFDSV